MNSDDATKNNTNNNNKNDKNDKNKNDNDNNVTSGRSEDQNISWNSRYSNTINLASLANELCQTNLSPEEIVGILFFLEIFTMIWFVIYGFEAAQDEETGAGRYLYPMCIPQDLFSKKYSVRQII